MLHGVGRRDVIKTITPDSTLRYVRRVIARVNKEEDNAEGQKRKTRTGIIKVSGFIHKRAKQCDPRLAWETFHKIYHMYSDIKNIEETNAYLLLTSMSDHKYMNQVSKTTVNSHDNHHRKNFPPDLHQIQPRATQVRNCDEIGLDPNGKWRKVVCTYKYFQGERMWKVQTGERTPFWCNLLVFIQADGK